LVDEGYVPDTGHIVWISLDPQVGYEQGGHRPFLVLSKRAYNNKTSMMVGVPVTSGRKPYPFRVDIRPVRSIEGAAMVDQILSVDWRARTVQYAEDVDEATLRDVRRLLAVFLELG
jgi:mRNA interferase MazF